MGALLIVLAGASIAILPAWQHDLHREAGQALDALVESANRTGVPITDPIVRTAIQARLDEAEKALARIRAEARGDSVVFARLRSQQGGEKR